jgi:hypothetical protein
MTSPEFQNIFVSAAVRSAVGCSAITDGAIFDFKIRAAASPAKGPSPLCLKTDRRMKDTLA